MRAIHVAPTLADAYVVRDVLQREGIPASIRNEHLGPASSPEGRPTVWVADGDLARAAFILGEYLRDEDAATALIDMAEQSPEDHRGASAQVVMGEIAAAAGRLAGGSGAGEAVDRLHSHAAFVTGTPVPFGVPAKTWEMIGRLLAATVAAAAAGDDDELELRATQLRDTLRPFV